MLSTTTHILALLFGIMISPQSACQVTFYEHGSYAGAAHGPFSVGDYSWVPDYGMANDQISSLKVLGADDCCVTVYQDSGFAGVNKEYCNEEVAWIGDEFNDQLSSFKLEACLVTFYEHGSYSGAAYGPFPVGEYDWVPYSGIVNDQISSLKVSGSDDCCVTVYEHGSFEGISKEFCNGDISWIGNEFNDILSSFKLSNEARPECSVTFYEHGTYGGAAYGPFDEGEYSWGPDFGMTNDAVSSLKVTGGIECCVTIYQDANYQGLSNTYCNADVSWVGNDWNDQLSSFKL